MVLAGYLGGLSPLDTHFSEADCKSMVTVNTKAVSNIAKEWELRFVHGLIRRGEYFLVNNILCLICTTTICTFYEYLKASL